MSSSGVKRGVERPRSLGSKVPFGVESFLSSKAEVFDEPNFLTLELTRYDGHFFTLENRVEVPLGVL
jgi:hypothetical protein